MDRIKESFDSLPIAACFFDKNGVVRLINRRMLAIANWLRKGGIQSLAEMQSVLHSPPANVRCLDLRLRIYRFPDGKALRFAQEQITTKAGVRYTQITAADVTELIRKQNQLKAENAKLAEANERLRRLLVQMPEIIREEETLAMKLRVHDDIGHSILAARRVLLQQTDLKELRANAALWEQSISVLFRSSQITAQSEPLEAAKKRAEELGVRVLLTGREPQRQWIRTLSALAICECAANCVRHADGTELYVRFRQKPDCMEVVLTNNGAVPKEKITEGGGLSMLRQRIEEAGGKMEVWSIPRFTLMLSLPEQEEQHMRVMIVEDQTMIRSLLESYFRAEDGYRITASIPGAKQAVEVCRTSSVDLILMDVQTENRENGLTAVRQIKAIQPKSKIIVVTSLIDCAVLDEAKRAGADSLWYKDSTQKRLMDVVRQTMAGEHIFPDAPPTVEIGMAKSTEFTKTELKVLRHLMRGLSYTRIAAEMGCEMSTVKFHVANMLQKTGLENKLQLALAVSDAKLIADLAEE